jgi:hypothetical protein
LDKVSGCFEGTRNFHVQDEEQAREAKQVASNGLHDNVFPEQRTGHNQRCEYVESYIYARTEVSMPA